MAAPLIGGAAVEAVFGELLKAVLEIKGKAIMFKQTLAYLRSTLTAIAPVVKEIEQHNNDLGRPKEELELLIREMEEGTKLVSKCSKILRLNYLARVRYQEQLVALVDSLVKFFLIDMQAQSARDQKETLLKVRRILSAVNKFPLVNREDIVGSSSDSASVPVDVSESEIHDSRARQPEENAMEINSFEEAVEHVNQVTRSSSSDSDTLPVDVNVSESESTATQPAEDAGGTNSAEQVMEPITGLTQEAGQSKVKAENNRGMGHLMSEKCYDQLRTAEKKFLGIRLPKIGGFKRQVKNATVEPPPSKATVAPAPVYCAECGTCIKQNVKLYTEGADKTSYSYCNLCYNEQVRPKGLVFLDSSYSFDLNDVLRASAEVLGKGSYGTTYKATLEDGSATVAVKRLREVTRRKTGFQQQVEIVQTSLPSHPNVCALRAYHYSRDEKLLIYDYIAAGSFSNLMHGKWETGWTPLDWDSRMKISLGAARGIAHIHSASGMNFVHGNIKSSNVLVTADLQGCISDFGVSRLVSSNSVKPSPNEGYRAPEVIETGELTQMSDVYSFGVILCQMLTGESPAQNSWQVMKLVQRVGQWTDQLFDPEHPIRKGEVMRIVRLAMKCVAKDPHLRPSMVEVVKKMEEIIASNAF